MLNIFTLASCGKCKTCDGTGYFLCDECNGEAFFYDEQYDLMVVCGKCTGTTEVECPDCMSWLGDKIKKMPYDLDIVE